MRRFPFLFLFLFPLIACSQRRTDRRITEALKEVADSLRVNGAGGTIAGTPGQLTQAGYIAELMKESGIPPAPGGYLESFSVDEGKMPAPSCALTIAGNPVSPDSGFFPLPYSASGSLHDTPLVSVQEQGSVWIIPVGDPSGTGNALSDSIYQKAAQAAADGASAVVFYTASTRDHSFQFDSRDLHPALGIPVVYVTKTVATRYFRNDSGSVDLELHSSVIGKVVKGYDVVGFIDHHAPATILICAHFDHPEGSPSNSGAIGTLMELGRMTQEEKSSGANYLFIVFGGRGNGIEGASWFGSQKTGSLKPDAVINLDLDRPAFGQGVLEVSGLATSRGWQPALVAANDPKITVKIPEEDSLISPGLVFARQGIPAITVSGDLETGQGQEPGKSQVRQIRMLYKLVQASASPGKLSYNPPNR